MNVILFAKGPNQLLVTLAVLCSAPSGLDGAVYPSIIANVFRIPSAGQASSPVPGVIG
jgi:hypothetical protein